MFAMSIFREFIIGSLKSLPFQVNLINLGENAYMTQLEFQLPEGTRLLGIVYTRLLLPPFCFLFFLLPYYSSAD